MIQKEASGSKVRAGPQKVFGILFEWLQYKNSSKPEGPFREVFREHILDTMPIAPNTLLFGERVAARRLHSVSSLAQKFDVHSKTVVNALKIAGIFAEDFDHHRDFGAIPVASGEKLMERVKRSVPVSRVPGYLRCKRTQVAQLIEAGVLKPIVGQRDGRRSISQGIDSRDLDAFLERLRSTGRIVSKPSKGMKRIVYVAEGIKVPTVEIVQVLLTKRLKNVELLGADRGFQSVLVDKNEVASLLGRQSGSTGISMSETARVLGLSARAVEYLLNKGPEDGDPALTICGQVRHMGQMRDMVDPVAVEKFQRDFRKLTLIAEDFDATVSAARDLLASTGLRPAWDPEKLGAEGVVDRFHTIAERSI